MFQCVLLARLGIPDKINARKPSLRNGAAHLEAGSIVAIVGLAVAEGANIRVRRLSTSMPARIKPGSAFLRAEGEVFKTVPSIIPIQGFPRFAVR